MQSLMVSGFNTMKQQRESIKTHSKMQETEELSKSINSVDPVETLPKMRSSYYNMITHIENKEKHTHLNRNLNYSSQGLGEHNTEVVEPIVQSTPIKSKYVSTTTAKTKIDDIMILEQENSTIKRNQRESDGDGQLELTISDSQRAILGIGNKAETEAMVPILNISDIKHRNWKPKKIITSQKGCNSSYGYPISSIIKKNRDSEQTTPDF